MKKLLQLLLLLLLCGCFKTIKIKVEGLKGLKYMEPAECEYNFTLKTYKTKIIITDLSRYIGFDEENMNTFLQNLSNQRLAIEKYKLCVKTNEDYYKSVINIILNGKKTKSK